MVIRLTPEKCGYFYFFRRMIKPILTISNIANNNRRWWNILWTFCLENVTIEKLLPTIPTRNATRIRTPSTRKANMSLASEFSSGNILISMTGRLMSMQLKIVFFAIVPSEASLEFHISLKVYFLLFTKSTHENVTP